jgi:cytochrome c oxidase assembly protein subunit 16
MPGPFTSKSFKATLPNSLAARYRKQLSKHPFLLFGLPFLTTIVAGSFMLTPATALRYERYDRKNQQITQEEAMGLRGDRRKVNMKDEYYVRLKLDAECLVRADKIVEAASKGLGELGAETSQTTAWRDRWYSGIGRSQACMH